MSYNVLKYAIKLMSVTAELCCKGPLIYEKNVYVYSFFIFFIVKLPFKSKIIRQIFIAMIGQGHEILCEKTFYGTMI